MTQHDARDVIVPGAVAPGYLVIPTAPRAAIVVCHEIFGRSPEIERVCHRLADAGYAALMPDLFGSRSKPVCIARGLAQIASGRGEFVDVIVAAADVVAAESGVDRERVGVIGFCMGGGFALATGKAFKATSTNYGELPAVDVLRGIGPTIGCYGTRDRKYRDNGRELSKRLTVLGVPHEIHDDFDAGHAFLADGHHPVMAGLTRFLLDVDSVRDANVREEAWQRILAFFARELAADQR